MIQFESSAVAVKYFHDIRADREWPDVRRLFAPDGRADDLPDDFDAGDKCKLLQFERFEWSNGKRFCIRHVYKVRYAAELKTHYLWNDGCWAEDRRDPLLKWAGQTAEAIKHREAKTISPEWDYKKDYGTYVERNKHIVFCVKLEEVHECEAMLKTVRADGTISVLPKAYQSFETLCQSVTDILAQVGTKFRLSFA